MNFTQRLTVFIIGIILGSVLASYIMRQRKAAAGEEKEVAAMLAPLGSEAVQREAVSGIISAYNRHQVPMHSEFIEDETSVEGSPQAGLTARYLLLRGAQPEQVLLIYEVTEADADKIWGQLEEVRIMAADRLQVRTASGVSREELAAALKPIGMQIIRGLPPEAEDPSAPLVVTLPKGVRWETGADHAQTDLYLVGFELKDAGSALQAIEALGNVDAAASIDFDYLDIGTRFVRRER